MKQIDLKQFTRAYKDHAMPLEMLAKQFGISVHKAIEILSWKLVEEKRDDSRRSRRI